jgi:internalin A
MSELALRLITENKQTKNPFLDLGNCSLRYSLPKELLECFWLKGLNLGEFFSNKKFPNWIQTPNQGEENTFSGNELIVLEKLTALQSLELGYNQISDIRFLEKLTQLQILDLSYNQISDIYYLANLTDLQSLDLSYNQISDIRFLERLIKLQSLDLRYNQISDISILEKLTSLQCLNLYSNQINDLKSLVPLLKNGLEIDLENQYIWHLQGKIGLKDNPIVTPPLEIVKQGKEAVIRYFENELETKYEGKLLIVGEPGAGKTTLQNRLLSPDYKVPNNTKATVGIQVAKWLPKYPRSRNKTMQVNVWDFGGQEIQYLTHQFFLTSDALYVLLTSARKDLDNLDYWFNIIRLLGKNENNQNSKLVVVANEINMEPVTHFVESDFKVRYPDLGFECLAVNFATRYNKDGRFKSLQFKITENLARLPSMGRKLPIKWGVIRKKLEEKSENSISIEKYLEICTDTKLDDKSAYDLSAYLHTIGEAIHFQNDYKVDDFIILKPQWAVDGVYVVLKEESVKKNGHFTQQQVYKIWQKNGYSKEECNRLLRLMAKDNFEVSYPLPESTGEYIAPQLLSEKQPTYKWKSENSLKFRYSYSFMPKGIITRFIVRLHEDIEYQDGEGIVWKNGVVLKDKYTGTMAQVREMKVAEKGFERKVIDIEVIGAKGERKSLLKKVCRTIEKIHNEAFSGLPFERLVPCNCPDCIGKEEVTFYDYSELVKRYERGKNVECKKELQEVKINDIFEEIIDLDATSKTRTFIFDKRFLDKEIAVKESFSDPFNAIQKERPIFFSYAWGDEKETGESREKIVNELYDSLKSDSYDVIRDKVDLGYKGLISDFMKRIGKGKIVIVAMTDKYFKSPYCMFELYEVYRNSMFEKEEFKEKIYPIRVESIAFDDNKVMADYLSYWKTKKEEKEILVRDFLDNIESEQFKEFEKIRNISLKFMEMITILKDMNALTKDLLSKNNFAEIKKAIEQKASKA